LRDLRVRSYISQAALDRQQAAFDAARARLAAADAQLRQALNTIDFQVLRADAAGVVTAVDAEVGQVVSQGQSVVRVAQAGSLEVAIQVPERELATVRDIAQWTVWVPAVRRELRARVREIAPLSDPGSRTFAARLTLEGPAGGIELGMTAVAKALRPEQPAVLLPISALHSKNGPPQVWVVDPDTRTVSAVEVTTAGLLDDAVRVVAGIRPGDRIVTAGANLLNPGQKVRLLEPAQ
ncbi:MAG TPA: efflux RND transporter periplasmic adaptor subunit, partial [Burkholderiaceae bacterium]|nr:efflux RND transporter periplasmic adaptor subunit [Burkholderiaceae bacterium]